MSDQSGARTCGPCTQSSNNKFFDGPSRMSDGRLFTDYRSRCDINFVGPHAADMDSYSYRQYLIKNADEIIHHKRGHAYDAARSGPCMRPFNRGTMLDEAQLEVCDARKCTRRQVGDGTGVGQGRWYSDANAGNADFMAFKMREQAALESMANCCGTRGDYEAYYPPPGTVQNINRMASPLGGTPLSGGDEVRF